MTGSQGGSGDICGNRRKKPQASITKLQGSFKTSSPGTNGARPCRRPAVACTRRSRRSKFAAKCPTARAAAGLRHSRAPLGAKSLAPSGIGCYVNLF